MPKAAGAREPGTDRGTTRGISNAAQNPFHSPTQAKGTQLGRWRWGRRSKDQITTPVVISATLPRPTALSGRWQGVGPVVPSPHGPQCAHRRWAYRHHVSLPSPVMPPSEPRERREMPPRDRHPAAPRWQRRAYRSDRHCLRLRHLLLRPPMAPRAEAIARDHRHQQAKADKLISAPSDVLPSPAAGSLPVPC